MKFLVHFFCNLVQGVGYLFLGEQSHISKKCLHCLQQEFQYSDMLQAGRSGNRILVEARFVAPIQTSPRAHPAYCAMGTGSISWGKSGQSVALTTHPHLALRLKKE